MSHHDADNAQRVSPRPIAEIPVGLRLRPDELQPFGDGIAKVTEGARLRIATQGRVGRECQQ